MTALGREITKYKLNLMGIQEVRWDRGGTEPEEVIHLSMEIGMRIMIHEFGMGFFVHKRIISAVKRVEFVGDKMWYVMLKGPWCGIIAGNIHAPAEDNTDDMDSLCEEVECVFNKFPKYDMNVFLGDLNAKVDREDIFKATIGNENLHKINNGNGARGRG
jgi:hypothetical protein